MSLWAEFFTIIVFWPPVVKVQATCLHMFSNFSIFTYVGTVGGRPWSVGEFQFILHRSLQNADLLWGVR
uniref:Secreted protein n=1 Tax=Arundo donax TaxID=35708 RepID=A0A0A9HQM4_ARUDO